MAGNDGVVLVTGASSGIGYAAALALARAGYDVVGTARSEEKLNALQSEVQSLPEDSGGFLPVVADVRDPEAMRSAVAACIDYFGALDVLIANAGLGQRGAVIEAPWGDLETLLRTNIDGVLHSIRVAVPQMAKGGQVIVISSIVANMTSPYAATYAASKAFVSSLVRSLRLELSELDIQVTEMLFGRVATAFNENRLGKGGRTGRFPGPMTMETAGDAIVKAVQRRPKRIAMRWIDRLILLGNVLIPGIIGRMAARQYK